MSVAGVAGVSVDPRHWIGGRRVASGVTFTDVSPIGEQPIAEVARGGASEVGAAVQAASDAFGGWAAAPREARARLLHAIAAGAHPVLGGGPNTELGGLYYQPTLPTGAKPGAEILTEEVFGPVLTLQTFGSEDEAVQLANATPYGLAATLFTGDERRAERVCARLRAGTVWVNCFFVRDLAAPFGGSGISGIGREGGTWSFDFYSDLKNTVYAPEGWQRDG